MPQILLDEPLVRNPDLIAAEMDGDTVMMSVERGEYYGVGGVGPRVWRLLETPVTLSSIVATICAEFDVDHPACQSDMERFIDELMDNGLVSRA